MYSKAPQTNQNGVLKKCSSNSQENKATKTKQAKNGRIINTGNKKRIKMAHFSLDVLIQML